MRIGRSLTAIAVLVAAGLALWAATGGGRSGGSDSGEESAMPAAGSAVTDVSADDLAKVARTRVFFGHQSVGGNLLGGVPGVFALHAVAAPPITEVGSGSGSEVGSGSGITPGAGGGFVAHALIGKNTRPLAKLKDFDAPIRGGLGRRVDVAMMKFCYVDITAGTDTGALFATYRDTLAALERDFPEVTFVKVTVPLTTEPGTAAQLKAGVKRLLRRDTGSARDDNAARERFNALLRSAYAGDHLFDLAAVESTAPDGSRVSGTVGGRPYLALYAGYAADEGHLNDAGARIAATAWLGAVARASSR